MKIIVREGNELKRCFIQLKDLNYLALRFHSVNLKGIVLSGKDTSKLSEYDFIEVRNSRIACLVEENPYIIDFSDAVKHDLLTLSRLVVLTPSNYDTRKKHLDEEQKMSDLQDIISFKKGSLPYQIPIMFDGGKSFNDGNVVFGSTTIPGIYMLKSVNGNIDLNEYFELNSNDLFESINLENIESYSVSSLSNCLLITPKEKKKGFGKKKNN